MCDKPSPGSLRYWVELSNERGHAGEFATSNAPGITEIVELGVASEFAKAMGSVFRVSLTNIRGNPHDPPDCFAEIDGRTVSIELVELVDEKALIFAKKTGRTAHNDAGQFDNTQWDADRFSKQINELIKNKGRKYQAMGKKFDCLLIYTGEPWLLTHDVSNWLSNTEFHLSDSFQSVFVLMSYDPLYSQEHWPLFNLYGDLRKG